MNRLVAIALLLAAGCSPEVRTDFATPADQARRSKSFQLISAYIDKIERTNLVVSPAWCNLKYEDKELIANAAAAYCFRVPNGGKLLPSESLLIKDYRSGKTIGIVTYRGLTLY